MKKVMEKVAVTGANGYIALHCIYQLLMLGYAVNGSVRSQKKKEIVFEALSKKNCPVTNLRLFTCNMTSDDGWSECLTQCNYLMHIASPMHLGNSNEEYFLKPALEGVNRIFKFANKSNIKKVIFTSSVAAIFETSVNKKFYDENDFSNPNKKNISLYAKSKTLAENTAWNFVKENNFPFELVIINPAQTIGAPITDNIGDSNNAIAQILTGQTKFIVPYKFGYVDVRDVAEAHIMAMQNSSSNGKRFPLVSKDLRHKEIVKILKENGFKDLPKFSIPIFLTICLGIFKKELRPDLKFIIHTKSIKKSTIAKDILGWKPRLAEDSILEVARYVKNKKF